MRYLVTSWTQTCGYSAINDYTIMFRDDDNCPVNFKRIIKKGRRILRERIKRYKKSNFFRGLGVVDDITLWKNMDVDGLSRWVKIHAYKLPITVIIEEV